MMGISNETFEAALCGLLHDVGKMEQRAREDPWKAPGDEPLKGQPIHAAWTMRFIEDNIPEWFRPAARHAAYHHNPEKSPAADQTLSKLIALSDKLSSGERIDQPESADQSEIPQQMLSIFDRVSLQKQPVKGENYLPLKSLALDRNVLFPGKENSSSDVVKTDYDRLCSLLRRAVQEPIQDQETYLETVLSSLQQTTWCVPSAYYHSLPDVSLYDHSRMTSALAVCMASWEETKVSTLLCAVIRAFREDMLEGDESKLDQPVALLLGGDLSGIQDFIYTITSRGAARTLRGRSFYLELLTEATLRFLLRELRVPYTNVVYSGGGHFYVLLPVEAEENLPRLQEAISRRLLKHHGTELYLAIGWSQIPAKGLARGVFPEYWSKMHQELGRAKMRRYQELGNDIHSLLFEPPELGGNPDAMCSVCGKESRQVHPFVAEDETQSVICDLCESFAEQIGRKLPSARYVALGLVSPKELNRGKASDALAAFGLHVQFLKNADEISQISGAERSILWSLGDRLQEKRLTQTEVPSAHWLKYTVNQVPAMSFDELQKQVIGGFRRLGVLRMDVDNLGEIFTYGFGGAGKDSRATLARLATLSMQVSLFFEGWIKRLIELQDYGELIYAVYAGGDDVFLIGPWDRIPDLAIKIHQDFSSYTATNPDLHLSGGMAFIGGKYPVYQAAEDAGAALDQAKGNPGKDSFTFLDQALKWSRFEAVAQKRDQLLELIQGRSEASHSLLQILQSLASHAREAQNRAGTFVWGPWMWQGAYRLTRMAERTSEQDTRDRLYQLRDSLDEENYSHIDEWGLAARWGQLLIRRRQSE